MKSVKFTTNDGLHYIEFVLNKKSDMFRVQISGSALTRDIHLGLCKDERKKIHEFLWDEQIKDTLELPGVKCLCVFYIERRTGRLTIKLSSGPHDGCLVLVNCYQLSIKESDIVRELFW